MPRPVPSLAWFGDALDQLARSLPLPQPTRFRGMTVYRYAERSAAQAALLKLARYISGLNAGSLLLKNGFFQELGALQSTLDEIHEDILFLCLPRFGLKETEHHRQYLEAFWEDEPEFRAFSANQKNRHQVPRRRIRAYLAQLEDGGGHMAIATSAYLSRLYSGFVHAAGPHIQELYDPDSESYRVDGFRNSPSAADHAEDFENQYFRGVISVSVVAHAINNTAVEKSAQSLERHLKEKFGY